MKLFKIWQDVNDFDDTCDCAVVCAKSGKEARGITPCHANGFYDCWCEKEYVKVKYLGEAKTGMKKGVVVASFNAG